MLREAPIDEAPLQLPAAPEGQEVLFDYAATGLSLRSHPMALLREQVARRRMLSSSQLRDMPHGRLARACGLVIMRQQPGTAKGTVFVTLEDEAGTINVIVWRDVRDQFRPALLQSRLLAVCGVWQRQGEVSHLVARRLDDWSAMLGSLSTRSRDFR